jgi:hypothetical protein
LEREARVRQEELKEMQRLIQQEREERERLEREAWEEERRQRRKREAREEERQQRREREIVYEQQWLERQRQLEEEQRWKEQQEKDDRAKRIARATNRAIEIDRQEAIARGEWSPSEGNTYVPKKRLPIVIAECDDSSSDDGYSSGEEGLL